MKEFWVRELVGQWEVPAPGFDSQEDIPEKVDELLPLKLQNEVFDTMAEEQTLDEDEVRIAISILGPVRKDGRKVFVARKIIFRKV